MECKAPMNGMKRALTLVILAVTVLGLGSCRLVKKNLDVMKDTVSTAQPDDVVVERGEGGAVAHTGETAAPAEHDHAAAPGAGAYTVQKGDTLSGIARRSGVTLAELRAANHMTGSEEDIRSGQVLEIPGGARHVTSTASAKGTDAAGSYTVKPGETLSGIAARHHTSVSAILKANGLKPEQADRIRDGKVLKMPAGKK